MKSLKKKVQIRSNIDRAHKDTLRHVIKCVLLNGSATLPELYEMLPAISKRSILKVVSGARNYPGVLDVPLRPRYRRVKTVVSLGLGFKGVFEEFRESVDISIDDWSSVLVTCDRAMKKAYVSEVNEGGMSHDGGGLDATDCSESGPEKVIRAFRELISSMSKSSTGIQGPKMPIQQDNADRTLAPTIPSD